MYGINFKKKAFKELAKISKSSIKNLAFSIVLLQMNQGQSVVKNYLTAMKICGE